LKNNKVHKTLSFTVSQNCRDSHWRPAQWTSLSSFIMADFFSFVHNTSITVEYTGI